MLRISITALGTALLVLSTQVRAETVAVGTSKGGANQQIGVAISNVVSSHTDIKMRPVPHAGMQTFIPMVDAGEIEFGVGNMMQLSMAVSGTGLSEGMKHENLRLVATLIKFQFGFVVPVSSGIDEVSDIREHKVPYGFSAAPLFPVLYQGMLAYGGLTYDDVEQVPVAGVRQGRNLFKQGRTEVDLTGVGSAVVSEMDAAVSGGLKYLSFDDAQAVKERVLPVMPNTYTVVVEPAPGLTGILETTHLLAYDYMLWVGADVDDDVVYEITKAIYEHADELKASGAVWNTFDPKGIAKDQGIPYHEGAVRYFKEVGLYKQ